VALGVDPEHTQPVDIETVVGRNVVEAGARDGNGRRLDSL